MGLGFAPRPRLSILDRWAIAAPILVASLLRVPAAGADPVPSAAPLPTILDGTKLGYGEGAPGNRSWAPLAEFLLTSRDGDHHIERIAVETGLSFGPFVAFHNREQDNCTWADKSSGLYHMCADTNTKYFYFDYRVGFYPMPPACTGDLCTKVRKTITCDGACTVAMNNPPAGFHFVLGGFSVSYDKDNKFVRRVSVLPYSAPGKLTMRFRDNGTPKFMGAIYGLFMPAAAFKSVKEEATLEYKPGKPPPKLHIGYDKFALLGFDFEFLNGDHKLKTIGFKYERPYLIPKLSDQNTDDPWRVTIRYAVLQ